MIHETLVRFRTGVERGRMTTADTSERGLERLICTALAGHPCGSVEGGPVGEARSAYGGGGWSGGNPP